MITHKDIVLAKAHTIGKPLDVTKYLVSEKLDGVRAIWTGEKFVTRQGHDINAPLWFTRGLPKSPLDGELWSGRDQFDSISATVRRKVHDDVEWDKIRYMVYEVPQALGTFEERITNLQLDWALAHKVIQYVVESVEELDTLLDHVINRKGEGLMLHERDSLWHGGRSSALLKYKPESDAEAIVVGYTDGKNDGETGALMVESSDGLIFKVGSGLTQEQRLNPPPIGTIITYKFRGLTKTGLPRFPTFFRIFQGH